ncbi:LuxR C-terminal-related transcriptional regulator [Nocardia mexicana]|uniref:LuxR C-terminal-related transcriptional regulator n=1 Tax=Nocardia mexicana TaxID=279262 RepID=UPI00083541F9|nr:LuxR C-terminal-related transcriptional regulator [Nocardia mexicana]
MRIAGPHARLDRATRTPNGHTALICAPAGTGKTVLVADWARRRSDVRIGWVGISDIAAETDRLWQAVGAALDLPIATAAHRIPDSPADEPAAILSALATRSDPAVLIIDDAHLISDPLTLSGLEHFVEHAPGSLTIVVVGRHDPPLRWHALEMTARLTRIGPHDLAFGEKHTAELLAQHDCRLTGSELSTIQEITCGWAGLVRIAAIHLAAHTGDRDTAIAALAQGPHAVADFLVGELLDVVSPEALDFLVATSVPDQFCADLAEELVGTTASRTLDLLLRNNFPLEVVARDGVLWYTYHPMLRTYLLAECARTDPGRSTELHRACAHWFTTAGLLPNALHHVLAEPGRPALTGFIRDHGPRMVFEGNGPALFRHLDHLEGAADDPFLLLLRIADAIEHADLVRASALADLIGERAHRNSAYAAPNLLRPFTDAVRCDVGVATGRVASGPPPESPAPTGHPDLDCYIALQTATAHTLAPGAPSWGEPELRHALALSERVRLHRLTLHALTRLALAAGLGGALTVMRERACRAVAFAEDHHLNDTAPLAHARVMAALMSYLQADDECTRLEILPLARRLDGSTAPAPGWHAEVLARLFDFDTTPDRHAVADTLRSEMHRLLDEAPQPATTGGLLVHVAWALLRVRWCETTRQLLDRAVAVLGPRPETTLVEAALADRNQRSVVTVELVEPLLERDDLHPVSAIHARLLYASACHRLDRPTATYEALHRALGLAYADRLVRPFLDVPGISELLDQFVGRFGYLDDFVDLVRRRSRTRGNAPQLTSTETTVLRQLPSGMTTHSIAADMGVSINTVKTHLRGIYHKLGVRTRADAITHARTLGLI